MKPYSKQETESIIASARLNIERFRYEAALANATYARKERRKLRRIRPTDVFYTRYKELFQPMTKELGRKRPFDVIKASLLKGLKVPTEEADNLTTTLYAQRRQQLIQETVALLPHRSQKHAQHLLRQSPEQVEKLLSHYQQAMLYRDTANTLRIAVYDPHSGIFYRTLSHWRIHRDRKNTLRSEQKRIAAIDYRLQAVDNEHGDLLRRIVSNDLEFIELVALRNEFMKKTRASRHTDVRREFTQFIKLTKGPVDKQLDVYLARNPDASLQDLGQKQHTIEKILQDVFALDNAERNGMVLAVADYSRIYREKEALLAARQARGEYINKVI